MDQSTDIYSIIMSVYALIVVVCIGFGIGENRKLVIFKNYDDLGLTFLVPASGVALYMVLQFLGVSPQFCLAVASFVSLALLGKLIYNTYLDNSGNILKTIICLNTKLPIAVIWILCLIQSLNPSGKNAAQRRSNRGGAMVILAVLTPILGLLVETKEGSMFNPKSWIKGRRVGSQVRSNL
jgi:hypothetical protein